jgi:hypothetical protein
VVVVVEEVEEDVDEDVDDEEVGLPLPGGGAAMASDTTKPQTNRAISKALIFIELLRPGGSGLLTIEDAGLRRTLSRASRKPPDG